MKKIGVLLCLVTVITVCAFGVEYTRNDYSKQKPQKTECQKQCSEKQEFEAKWAKFESLHSEEQEKLLAKRAEWFIQCKAKCEAKQKESKENREACKNKTDQEKSACEAKLSEYRKAMEQIGVEWQKYESMTIAEKKSFFDRLDKLMPAKDKDKKSCNKEKGKEKACCKK